MYSIVLCCQSSYNDARYMNIYLYISILITYINIFIIFNTSRSFWLAILKVNRKMKKCSQPCSKSNCLVVYRGQTNKHFSNTDFDTEIQLYFLTVYLISIILSICSAIFLDTGPPSSLPWCLQIKDKIRVDIGSWMLVTSNIKREPEKFLALPRREEPRTMLCIC